MWPKDFSKLPILKKITAKGFGCMPTLNQDEKIKSYAVVVVSSY